MQIDHLVALSDAWQKGAQRLSAEQRRQLANDPLNLMAADGSLNASKGDGDAATWLPPHKKFRCTYVARQVAVKHSYNLWVTSAERDAMRRVLSTCPDKKLPAGDVTEPAAPLLPETATTQEPAQQPTKKPATKPEPATGSGGSSVGGSVVSGSIVSASAVSGDTGSVVGSVSVGVGSSLRPQLISRLRMSRPNRIFIAPPKRQPGSARLDYFISR